MNCIIYVLSDPETNEIRYVGQSYKGTARAEHHWRHKHLRERHDYCHTWIRSLLKKGLLPLVEIAEELDAVEQLNDAEKFWISYFRFIGCRLTNMTDGGEGVKNPPLSVREKQRSANIGNKNGVGHKYVMSDDRKKQVGDQHRGKIETAETRLKKSLSQKKRWERWRDQRIRKST